MDITLIGVLAAAAGGFFGAVLGGLISFVFLGFAVLIGIGVTVATGDSSFMDVIAWGALFGPHIVFAAGCAASAYAAKRGALDSGRNIGLPLISLNRIDVLLVGSGFGVLGYLMTQGIGQIPWLGTRIDAIAASIFISSIIVRLAFGSTGLIGKHSQGLTGYGKFKPTDAHAWLPWQSQGPSITVLGLFLGALSGYMTWQLVGLFPEAAGSVILVGFGVSSVALMWLVLGHPMPVTHHITLQSALAVLLAMGRWPGLDPLWLVLIAAAAGAIASLVAEVISRLFTIRGDTHIDPPTAANVIVALGLTVALTS